MTEKLMNTGNVIKGNLVEEIRKCRQIKRPMMIYGSPGVGKSEQVAQALEPDDVLIDLRLNTLDSIDLRGLPVIKKDSSGNPISVEWVRPEFIPWKGKGILFLDEINTAPPSVQNPALQLVLDGKVGPHELGKLWYIVAAGNKAEDKAHVYPLSTALLTRFAIYEYVPDHNSWSNWAVKNDLHPDVISFMAFKPELLISNRIDEYTPNPNPRSWRFVSDRLKVGQNKIEDIRSLVGTAANEFMSFKSVCENLPSIEDILSGKIKFEKNDKITINYAVASALATHLIRNKNIKPNMIENCFEALLQMEGEPTVMFVRRVTNSENEQLKIGLAMSKNGKKWFEKYGSLVKRAMIG
jgi:hypothetical protein